MEEACRQEAVILCVPIRGFEQALLRIRVAERRHHEGRRRRG